MNETTPIPIPLRRRANDPLIENIFQRLDTIDRSIDRINRRLEQLIALRERVESGLGTNRDKATEAMVKAESLSRDLEAYKQDQGKKELAQSEERTKEARKNFVTLVMAIASAAISAAMLGLERLLK